MISMPDLKNKQQLADAAMTLATSYDLVQREATTFIPVHWETGNPEPPPAPGERIWVPLSRDDKRRLANIKSKILFANDGELRSFEFMVKQLAKPNTDDITHILVKTKDGMQRLNGKGQLEDHDDSFTPNYVKPLLNEDLDDKQEVFDTFTEWLGGSVREADSLLNHLATCLAPGYSAVKYILLLGEGRNGKGVLLSMLSGLFGSENISGITRQLMAEKSPTCVELNDKLLNVVFDGEMAYIKDSSMEKTLIAGEPGKVRMLYENGTTTVQTNALFIEALNLEPKARDKSSALQKRLVRFQFPNIYAQDKAFHRHMTSEKMLGALLSLLIDHYVEEKDIALKLTPTDKSKELEMDQVWITSPVLQYLDYLMGTDPSAVAKIEAGNYPVDSLLASLKPWAETQHMQDRSDGDFLLLLKSAFDIGWKTTRVNGKPKNQKVLKGLKPETTAALELMKGAQSGTEDPGDKLVGD
jgi:phage/plasmid-associated DNA primase